METRYYFGDDPPDIRDEDIYITVDFLDKNGNVVERWFPNDPRESKRRFTYQFDANGNWITRDTFKVETVDGKETLKLHDTSVRTITYY